MKTFNLHHVEYTLESKDLRERKVFLTNNVNENLLEIDISDLFLIANEKCSVWDMSGDRRESFVNDNLECFISENISKGTILHP